MLIDADSPASSKAAFSRQARFLTANTKPTPNTVTVNLFSIA
jgi:hypothetical protein